MPDVEVTLPKLGESIVQATIVSINKKEGQLIKKDESLMEVATDKVNSEIPSPVSGTIKKIFVEENSIVNIGEKIAIIATEEVLKATPLEKFDKKTDEKDKSVDKKSFFTPIVLRLAKEKHLKISDLEKIHGSGEGGRLTRKDIENYLPQMEESGNLTPLSPMRKKIAENMTKSLSVPHAYLVDEVDVTELMHFINEKKKEFFEKNESKLTITTLAAKAVAVACKKYPHANSSFDNNHLRVHKNINLGIAVNVEDNVIVPVIKDIDNMDIIDISKSVSTLAKKARSNTLSTDDISSGTITLTNFGMTKVLMGFPIIKYPEACIIALGAINKKLVAIDETNQLRSTMMITLSFDHRVYDGIYACKFIKEIKSYLENEFKSSI